jgi:hypothetical protein
MHHAAACGLGGWAEPLHSAAVAMDTTGRHKLSARSVFVLLVSWG